MQIKTRAMSWLEIERFGNPLQNRVLRNLYMMF